jgi:CDP-glycerol glycerophosphotransferase (TagB/SpsB family)
MLDDRPDIFLEYSRSEVEETINFLNKNANVVVYYEIFSINEYIKPPQIMLTHGNSFKDYYAGWREGYLKYFKYLAGLGPVWEKNTLLRGGSPEQIIKVGIARTDEMIQHAGSVKRKAVARRLGLDPKKQIISYMPTWWGPTSVNDTGKQIMRNISEEYSVIFRPHPSTPPELINEYKSIIDTEKLNAVYVPDGAYDGVDIESIYLASSLFIIDMSSVLIDALLTDKPLIFAFGDNDRSQDESVYSPFKSFFNACKHIDSSNAFNVNTAIREALQSPVKDDILQAAKDAVVYDTNGDSVEKIVSILNDVIVEFRTI